MDNRDAIVLLHEKGVNFDNVGYSSKDSMLFEKAMNNLKGMPEHLYMMLEHVHINQNRISDIQAYILPRFSDIYKAERLIAIALDEITTGRPKSQRQVARELMRSYSYFRRVHKKNYFMVLAALNDLYWMAVDYKA